MEDVHSFLKIKIIIHKRSKTKNVFKQQQDQQKIGIQYAFT